MAVFSNNTGFGGPPPRTVTYNADTLTAAQSRSANLGSRVIAWTLGSAAILLAVVSLLMVWGFTSSLAVSWAETIKLGLVGAGIVGALSGLPIAAALLARSYPSEARWTMRSWLLALAVVAAAAAVFSLRLENPGVRDTAVTTHLAPPADAPAVRSLYMTRSIWSGTAGCTTSRTLYDKEVCGEYRATLAARGISGERKVIVAGPAADWSPSGVLGVERLADGTARQVVVMLLSLIAAAGSGLLGRVSVLATAESYRLGEGMASAAPMPAQPVQVAAPGPGVVPPSDPFQAWADGRLIPDPGAEVTADALWNDYNETMRLNGFAGMNNARFFNAMGELAARSGGRVSKVKNNTIRYRGIRLPEGVGVANGIYN